jgi:hypothetical protein
MLASAILNRASRTLFDLTNVRWPESELLDYIADGQHAIILHRPDANAVNGVMPLAVGTRQELPVGGIRFLRAVRNMGNGATPGRAIRECSRVALDNEDPDWHLVSGASATIQHYIFDNIDPRHFYVYPPAVSTAVNIEVIYSALPAAVTSAGDTLTLPDQYINAIYDWVLYRAYSKDASYAGNMQRAQHHLQAFGAYLGVTMQIEFAAASSQAATPTAAAAPQARTGG